MQPAYYEDFEEIKNKMNAIDVCIFMNMYNYSYFLLNQFLYFSNATAFKFQLENLLITSFVVCRKLAFVWWGTQHNYILSQTKV